MDDRNQKQIELFGEKLILHARDASDVYSLDDFAKNEIKNNKDNILLLCSGISFGLKYNKKEYDKSFKESLIKNFLVKCKLFNSYAKKKEEIKSIITFNNKLTPDYIMHNLSILQLNSLMIQIGELEGIKFEENSDSEKKSQMK